MLALTQLVDRCRRAVLSPAQRRYLDPLAITAPLVDRAVEELRQVALAGERAEELEAALGLADERVSLFHLTPHRQRMLGMLLARPSVSTDGFVAALYAHVPEADRPQSPRDVIKVQIHHLRRDLKPYGIEIETRWRDEAATYLLDDANKQKARALLAAPA
jgi:hypothetical protein